MPFGRCERCGWVGIVQTHHKIPVSEGGTEDAGNLELLCPNCHTDEHCNCAYRLEMFDETEQMWDEGNEEGITWLHDNLFDCLITDKTLAIAVYMVLKYHSLNHEGFVVMTTEQIGDAVGCSAPTVSKGLQSLRDAGLLQQASMIELRSRQLLESPTNCEE